MEANLGCNDLIGRLDNGDFCGSSGMRFRAMMVRSQLYDGSGSCRRHACVLEAFTMEVSHYYAD